MIRQMQTMRRHAILGWLCAAGARINALKASQTALDWILMALSVLLAAIFIWHWFFYPEGEPEK